MNIDAIQKIDEVIATKVLGWGPDNVIQPFSSSFLSTSLVMANMTARGLSWKFRKGSLEGKDFTSVELTGPGGVFEVGSAETLEMAICLAALKVVDRMELY
jgi:hypothetical protein